MNCSGDLKIFSNSWPSASNFKNFSRSLEQLFLTVGQNNFGKKIPFLHILTKKKKIRKKMEINYFIYLQALEDAKTAVRIDSNFVKGFVRISKCCVALGDTTSAKQVIF